MTDRVRPYLFYDVAVSICSTCYQKIEAKIVFEDGKVFMLKHCFQHGHERVLIADDVDYYRRCREDLHQAAGNAAALQHAGEVGLSVRLRAVHRSRAAFMPVAHRDLRRLQPDVPGLLRRERPSSPVVSHPRADRADARRRRAQRRRAGRRADLRRRADAPSELLRGAGSRETAADPSSDGQHQRPEDRRERSVHRAPRVLHAGLRGLSPVRFLRTRRADRAPRRRPARRARSARWSG